MSQSLYQNLKDIEKVKDDSEHEINHLRKQVQELLGQIDISAQGTGRLMPNYDKHSSNSSHKLNILVNSLGNNLSDYNDLYNNDLEYQYTSGDKQLLKVMEESNLYAKSDDNIHDKYQSIRGKTELRSEYTNSSQKKLSVPSRNSSKHNTEQDEDINNLDNEIYQHSFGKKQSKYDQYYE